MESVGNVTVNFEQGSNADRKQPPRSQKRVYFQQKAPNAVREKDLDGFFTKGGRRGHVEARTETRSKISKESYH